MSLPREFRRLRIGLIGFGDVARRTFLQRVQQRATAHGPRFILIGRSGKPTFPLTLQRAIRSSRSLLLQADLDQRRSAQRLAGIAQHAIVYVPTSDGHGNDLTKDARARTLRTALRSRTRRLRLVYLSTTGVYGNYNGGEVNEHSACTTRQPRSLRRLDAERQLRPIGAHVLRVPGIYGHDRLPLARLQAGQPALRAQDDVYTNHIHADDLARIAWIALFRGRPGRVTNAVDDTTMKMGDYFDAVADAAGLARPPRVSRDEMGQLAREGVIHPMMLGFMSESRRVCGDRLKNELRVRLRYPTVGDTLLSLYSSSSRK